MPTNKARILKGRRVLQVYRDNHTTYKNRPEEPDDQAIQDLLTDLMHYAYHRRFNVGKIVTMAQINFSAEATGIERINPCL